jgi:hypothetical protein
MDGVWVDEKDRVEGEGAKRDNNREERERGEWSVCSEWRGMEVRRCWMSAVLRPAFPFGVANEVGPPSLAMLSIEFGGAKHSTIYRPPSAPARAHTHTAVR